MPVEILREFKERFHVEIKEGYGLSETSPVATFNPPGREPQAGSIGMPIWGVEVKLIDPEWNDDRRTPTRSARSRSAATTS